MTSWHHQHHPQVQQVEQEQHQDCQEYPHQSRASPCLPVMFLPGAGLGALH